MMRALRADGSVKRGDSAAPRGASAKFRYDAENGRDDAVWRPLPAGVAYPYDWGMIPSTRAADGDPLDVMVLLGRHRLSGAGRALASSSACSAWNRRTPGGRGAGERNDCAVRPAEHVTAARRHPQHLRRRGTGAARARTILRARGLRSKESSCDYSPVSRAPKTPKFSCGTRSSLQSSTAP